MVKVSIIIPVYNAEKYLKQCLESLVRQTEQNMEIICVDDGSTDHSFDILKDYSTKYEYISVLSQSNMGAAAARNKGIQQAKGEYLLFLDADDFFEPDLVEATYEKAKEQQLDILIFEADEYDNQTGKLRLTNRFLNDKLLPAKEIFSKEDIPDIIFNITIPCPWNKLFLKEFVLEKGIEFQNLKRSNDIFFVFTGIAKAERIGTLKRAFIHYRVNNEESLQANNTQSPLLFYEAFKALKMELEASGIYSMLEKSFANVALRNCIYILHSLKGIQQFKELYEQLNHHILEEFSIIGHEQEYFYNALDYKNMRRITEISYDEYLFLRVADVKNAYKNYKEKNPKQSDIKKELKDIKKELKESNKEQEKNKKKIEEQKKELDRLKKIENSNSYKIGKKITAIPNAVRKKMK